MIYFTLFNKVKKFNKTFRTQEKRDFYRIFGKNGSKSACTFRFV